MRIAVARATRADFEAAERSSSPLMFNYEFVDLLSKATGFPNVSLTLSTGDERFLLPVLRRRALRVIPLDFSLPLGMYGALHPEPRDPVMYGKLLNAARRHLGAGLVVHNAAHEIIPGGGVIPIAPHTTHVLNTRGATYDELFKKTFDAKLRNQIRKGERSQLEVRSTNDVPSLHAFYELYLMSNERWGKSKPKYERRFFETFAGAPFFAVKLALLEGRPIAGIVVLKFRDQHCYWFGALDKAHSKLCPNHLLISIALKEAIAEGTGFFDFGASGSHESVRKFKESFGAEMRSFASYFAGNRLVAEVLGYRMRRA
jgi:hypothetical protein